MPPNTNRRWSSTNVAVLSAKAQTHHPQQQGKERAYWFLIVGVLPVMIASCHRMKLVIASLLAAPDQELFRAFSVSEILRFRVSARLGGQSVHGGNVWNTRTPTKTAAPIDETPPSRYPHTVHGGEAFSEGVSSRTPSEA